MLRALVIAAVIAALATGAYAEDDDTTGRSLVFVRGTALIKADARGKTETEIATLTTKAAVRALRVDALGKVLLADIAGTWSWMPLDGSTKSLTELPCDPGPAQLAEDGLCVLCRAKTGGPKGPGDRGRAPEASANAGERGSIIVNLATGKVTPVEIPAVGARLAGMGTERKLVWADQGAVWTASPSDPKKAKKAAATAPLRSLLPSPDGSRAIGVYQDEVFKGREKQTGEVLSVFALDGEGARRKAIQKGVPVEWSHDSQWILIQDGSSACVMLAAGGHYKCWRGYTAASIAPDGKYALVLGNRDRGSKSKDKKSKKRDKKKKKKQAPAPVDEPNAELETEMESGGLAPTLGGDEHGAEPMPTDDVPIPPPTGPLALYRAAIEGAHTKSPSLVTRVVDGAAVWLPTAP